jgi:uncharacterized membrane protein
LRTPFPHILIVFLVHVVLVLSIAFNIPIVRQIFGFVYLLFIPGFAILKILKLEERDATSAILFSVGLSMAFLMFVGLIINELYPLFGILRPLSAIPLTTTLMVLTIILLFVGYKSELARVVNIAFPINITKKTLFKASFLVLPSIFGIFGALYHCTAALLIMIVMVAAIWALAVFSRKLVPTELYPLAILAIGLALLFHTTLISNFNLGNDINAEYYTFKLTEVQGYWNKPGIAAYTSQIANFESDLSVTILPTIISILLNINGEFIFKLIFAFILSLIPLGIYRICDLQIGKKKYALLSAFFFMSTPYSFYGIEPLAVERQIVATLFFILSILLIVDKKIELLKRRIMFMIFGIALIVSHYSLAYIYLSFIIFVFILSYRHAKKDILGSLIVLFLITSTFSWYTFASISPTLTLARNIENMYQSVITELFSPAARSSTVFTYLNPSTAASVVGLVHRLLVYVENGFIVIGVIMLMVKRKEALFTREYKYMSILSMLILAASFAVPRFAPALNFTRFYGITLLFLAPFFVFGVEAFFALVKKMGSLLHAKFSKLHRGRQQLQAPNNLVLGFATMILIVTFLFQVGFVAHVTGSDPLSLSLDFDRRKTTTNLSLKMSFYEVYSPEQDVYSAKWCASHINTETRFYSDYISKTNVLTAYSTVDRDAIGVLSNDTVKQHGVYVYLRLLNVYDNIFVTDTGVLNTSQFSFLFNESNKIYSNGASEIYYKP